MSEITRVDLVVERRVGETLKIVLPFAIVALFVFPLAIGFQLSILASAGPAIFWSLGLLFGMQIALRRTADDTAERRDLMALLGVDPAARFVGKNHLGKRPDPGVSIGPLPGDDFALWSGSSQRLRGSWLASRQS